MASVNLDVFINHSPVTLGLLKNGPPADVARTARKSSVAPKYYFRGVEYRADLRGNPAAFAPACPPIVLFEAQARNAFGTIVEAAVAEARAAHAAGVAAGTINGAFDGTAARASAAAAPGNRLEAIGLGAVHTALVLSYEITLGEIQPTETARRFVNVVAPAPSADAAALAVAERDPTAGWTIVVRSGNAAGATTEAENVVLNMAAVTADEAELAFAIMSMAQAAPVRAGAQLFSDGHHYHSDADGSARHRAIEREVIGRTGAGAVNLWRANLMVLRNVVWHAGIHPVKAGILQSFAEDANMPARLDATGFGSMSVGLPAQEDLFQRANSYIACLNQVLQTALAHDHSLSLDNLIATVNALANLPRTGNLTAQRPALPGLPAGAWPPGCDTRAKALKLYLEPALNVAEPVAAWMFGFYKEICSRGGIRAASQEGSLLRSYSLKRAVANYLGEANRAQEMFAARARFVRAEGEKGKLESYSGSA